MQAFVQSLSDLIYANLLIPLLLGVGLYFTVRMRFIQVRHFPYMFRVLAGSRRAGEGQISSFQALATSLAARVGTGNLAGVAIAITMGGPGAVFWMWMVAFLGMSTSFIESTLAQVFKVRGPDGGYRGGPAYYMQRGLGQRWMGVVFSLSLMVAFGLIFNAVQANTIARAFDESFSISTYVMAAILAVLTGLIIFGGIRAVARFAELAVPVMAVFYMVLALFVVLRNLGSLPGAIALVLENAFGFRQAAAGVVAYSVRQAVMNGVRRGLFSNESGVGSAPNAAATADPQPPHPASQGYVQMLGVFFDTIVICTCTAAIILVSGAFVPGGEVSGIQLTQQALSTQVGAWGSPFVAIAVLLFAFTSIVANYSYAETNLLFLNGGRGALTAYRIVVMAMVAFGSVAEVPLVWAMADVSMALMALLNIVAIVLLSRIALAVAADFNRQLEQGVRPTFDVSAIPGLAAPMRAGDLGGWRNRLTNGFGTLRDNTRSLPDRDLYLGNEDVRAKSSINFRRVGCL